jgi:hypothetical protein
MPIMITSSSSIATVLLACGLFAVPAQAGPNRTFVSGTGTDSGTCSRTAPCRTFAFALTQTAAGGEIDVLDPADYGTVIINTAISIINDGVGVAAIQAGSSVNGVTINAGASDSVHLRRTRNQQLKRHRVRLGREPRHRKLRHPEFSDRNLYHAHHVEQLIGVEYDCFQ